MNIDCTFEHKVSRAENQKLTSTANFCNSHKLNHLWDSASWHTFRDITIDRREERGVERGSARRSFLKGRTLVLFQKQRWGNSRETGWSAYGYFRAHWYHLGHHTINHLEERGLERGSARRSSLKGRERAIVNQTNTKTVLKPTLGKLPQDGVERIWAFPSA